MLRAFPSLFFNWSFSTAPFPLNWMFQNVKTFWTQPRFSLYSGHAPPLLLTSPVSTLLISTLDYLSSSFCLTSSLFLLVNAWGGQLMFSFPVLCVTDKAHNIILQPFPMCSKSPLFGLSSNHLDSYNTKWWHWTLNQSKTLLLESTVSIVVYHVAYKCLKDLSFSLNTVRVKARLTLPPQAAPERILRWARRNTSLSHSMCTG